MIQGLLPITWLLFFYSGLTGLRTDVCRQRPSGTIRFPEGRGSTGSSWIRHGTAGPFKVVVEHNVPMLVSQRRSETLRCWNSVLHRAVETLARYSGVDGPGLLDSVVSVRGETTISERRIRVDEAQDDTIDTGTILRGQISSLPSPPLSASLS